MRVLKYIILLFVGILFATNVQAATFIEGLEDVPIMNGLRQEKADNVSFGNEEGRFIEVYLSGKKVKFKQVKNFYKDTLPQLGWIYQGERDKNILIFLRDGETMEVAEDDVSPLKVRITVKSKN